MKLTRAEFLKWMATSAASAYVGCAGEIGGGRANDGAGGMRSDGVGGMGDGLVGGAGSGGIVVPDVDPDAGTGADASTPTTPPVGPPVVPPEGALAQYSGVTHQEIAEAWPGFQETLPPVLQDGAEVIETTFSQLATVAAANPGRQIRVTESDPTTTAQLVGVVDVEVLIPDGVSVGLVRVEEGSLRVRVRGEGPDSRISGGRLGGGAHTTFHSLLMSGDQFSSTMQIGGAAGPTSYISCIAGSRVSPAPDVGLQSDASDVLIANCNLGSQDAGGVNDWCLRFSGVSRVVLVDSFFEARGRQPVLRRASGSSRYFVKRVTTYNAGNGEAIADVGVGDGGYVLEDCYLYDCVSYLGGDAIRFGGYNRGADDHSAVWRVQDHTFHTAASSPLDASLLSVLEGQARNAGDWQYQLGNTTFNAWDGTHPGWPARIGFHGEPMAIADPYAV